MIEREVCPSAVPKRSAGNAGQALVAVVVTRIVPTTPPRALAPFHWQALAWDVKAVLVNQV